MFDRPPSWDFARSEAFGANQLLLVSKTIIRGFSVAFLAVAPLFTGGCSESGPQLSNGRAPNTASVSDAEVRHVFGRGALPNTARSPTVEKAPRIDPPAVIPGNQSAGPEVHWI